MVSRDITPISYFSHQQGKYHKQTDRQWSPHHSACRSMRDEDEDNAWWPPSEYISLDKTGGPDHKTHRFYLQNTAFVYRRKIEKNILGCWVWRQWFFIIIFAYLIIIRLGDIYYKIHDMTHYGNFYFGKIGDWDSQLSHSETEYQTGDFHVGILFFLSITGSGCLSLLLFIMEDIHDSKSFLWSHQVDVWMTG